MIKNQDSCFHLWPQPCYHQNHPDTIETTELVSPRTPLVFGFLACDWSDAQMQKISWKKNENQMPNLRPFFVDVKSIIVFQKSSCSNIQLIQNLY